MPNKNTLFVGKVLYRFPSLDSTNRYAQELIAKSGPIEGTAILTYHQTAGRGQIGSKWEGEPGKNIAFSLILYPRFLPGQRQFLLSQAVALAARELLADYLDKAVKIKWPNDIYVDGGKMAGILIQNTLSGRHFAASVVGLGINVNQTVFPSGLPNPTSLSLESGRTHDLDELVVDLCYRLEGRYLQLRRGEEAAIEAAYRQHLYRYGEKTVFRRPGGEVFSGSIAGVTQQGQLLIESAGQTQPFDLKTVAYQ